MSETQPDNSNRSVLSRQLVLSLYLPAIIISLGNGLIAPVLPVYAKSFDIGFGQAAMIFVAFQVGAVLFTFPTGILMDKLGRRPILLAGPFITAISSFLVATASSYPQLLIYRFAGGAAVEMWMQARLAVITESARANQRARQIVWMTGLQRVGLLLGPTMGGLLAIWDIRVPFILHGLLMLFIVVPCFALVPETRRARSEGEGEGGGDAANQGEWSALFKYILTPQMLTFFCIQFLATTSRGGETGTFNLYAAFAYGASPAVIGLLSGAGALVALPVPFISGYLIDRYSRKGIIAPAFALLGTTLGIISLTAFLQLPFHYYVVAFLISHMTLGTTNGTMQVLGSDRSPNFARGRFFGIWRTLTHLGALTSPAAFAFWAESLGFGFSFLFLVGTCYAVAFLVAVVLREQKVEQATDGTPSPS